MIPYILNVGLVLTACLCFYKLLLKKETFYRVNRYVLMLCLLIAFSLPLIHIPQQFSLRKNETVTINTNHVAPVKNIEANKNINANSTSSVQPNIEVKSTNSFSFNQLLQWAVLLYWFGVIVFSLNFLLQIIILFYRAYSNPVIKDGKFRIVEVKGDKAPCSFGNNIFIDPEKYEWDVYNQILQHEKVHIQQKHSLDILFAELVLIVQWFNPFAWLYRKEVESNLEFLTDDELVQKEEVEKSSYQLSLLKVSAPHFPLSLTTNYNQSLLKKRITMMNTKKSSIHTAWKYFFLLPLLVVLTSILNEPIAKAQDNKTANADKQTEHYNDIKTEGYWFATIKDNEIKFRFTQDESDHDNYNSSEFSLSDFPNLPKGTNGDFKLTREAGTMNFNGKFEGNQGMGRYKFEPNKDFKDYMSAQNIGKLDDEDMMTFFFVNVTKGYFQMLKDEGFSDIEKNNLIALCALNVDKPFIESIKANGYKDFSLEQLPALKSLGVDGAYIKEIKDAGYKDISLEQLISFKAQGIDKDYLSKLPKTTGKGGTMSADNVVSLKALNVDAAYANSFKSLGYDDIDAEQLVSMKAVGVTPEYVKEFQGLGYKNIGAEQLVGMKSQNITPEYIKSFENAGFKNIDLENFVSLKALNVEPAYIKSFKDAGYNDISPEEAVSLKSQNITPEYLNSFASVGFKNISLDNAVAIKAMGITPEWIKDMQAKGFNYSDINKYITLKSLSEK